MPRIVCSYCTLIVDSYDQLNSLTNKVVVNSAKYVDSGDLFGLFQPNAPPQVEEVQFWTLKHLKHPVKSIVTIAHN